VNDFLRSTTGIARLLKHWVCNHETPGSIESRPQRARCKYELLTFILAPTTPTSLKLRSVRMLLPN